MSTLSVSLHGAVAGDKPAELVPAGDQHEAAGPSGQQRADLVRVAGVVQQDQHPLAGERAPVQRGGLVDVERDVARWDTERVQEPRERVDRP